MPLKWKWSIAFAGVFLFALPAAAREVAFTATVDGEERYARATVVEIRGVPYVSLSEITEQFGGGYSVLRSRTKVNFQGATAWVQFNDNRVNALSFFELEHSVLRREGDVLMAVVDIPTMFTKAFRVPTQQEDDTQKVQEPAREPTGMAPELAELNLRPERERERSGPAERRSPRSRSGPQTRSIGVIVIDPGHGGYDTGIETPNGLTEKRLTLGVAQAMQSALAEAVDRDVVLTRTEDAAMALADRAVKAADSDGDLLISLHAGASLGGAANGAAFFLNPDDPASGRVKRENFIRDAMDHGAMDYSGQNRSIADAMAGALDDAAIPVHGVHEMPCQILARVNMPALLIEVGFLTHETDASQLASEEYVTKLGAALADGLAAYLEEHPAAGSAEQSSQPEFSEITPPE